MIRTQVQLTEAQERRLRALARKERISLAEAVRRCVDRALPEIRGDQASRYERAARVVGIAAGPRDLSRKHDSYLDEAFD